jgi:pyruvate/2-oxoglutarate/acetoin dehydrogenase E1 component
VAEIGRAAVLREGNDLTIVATMLMVHRALEAANTLATMGIEAEVIDLRWIRPLDLDTVRKSVGKTGRLLVVEEQVHSGGWGATVISRLASEGTSWRAAPKAVSLPDHLLIPYSPSLEDEILPSAADCVDAARGLVGRT